MLSASAELAALWRAEVHLQLERGAYPDMVLEDGWTELHVAITCGDEETVRLVLSYGPSPAEYGGVPVPQVRDCRAAVEEAVLSAGDRDVARLCGDYVSMVDRWRPPPARQTRREDADAPAAKRARHSQ